MRVMGSQEEKKMMTDTDRVQFGNRLAKLAADKHWTETEFARQVSKRFHGGLDFRRWDIALYLHGIQFPSPPRLRAICEALGVEEKALGLEAGSLKH
jgi:hypothetical protein